MSSVSNGLYFLTLPLVSVMRIIYRKIRHARYLYIKMNVEKVWGARYTLGARYLSKNMVHDVFSFHTRTTNVMIISGGINCLAVIHCQSRILVAIDIKLLVKWKRL